MILSHTNAIEKVLVAQSVAAQNAGHPNLRGGPREWFIRDFLQNHLPGHVEIGQGEIIDEDSKPNPPQDCYRPQVDIVIYRRDLPRIMYSNDNSAYLAEGVVATLESKSVLTKDELKNACKATLTHKSLKRATSQFTFGPTPASIFSYVIAYGGPTNISTIANWLPEITSDLNSSATMLTDMIVVLGKGVIWHTETFKGVSALKPQKGTWAYFDQEDKNLFMLFMHMLTWASYLSAPPSTLNYVSKVLFEPYETV